MSQETLTFAISFLSLVVAIATFIMGNDNGSNNGVRYGIGSSFLLLALIFGAAGVFALMGGDLGEGVLPPVATQVPTATASSDTLTQSDINGLFSAGNWFCFPDRENGVGVRLLPANFQVGPPLRYIDTYRGRYLVGEVETGQIGATAELTSRLPRSQCPANQQSALDAWWEARGSSHQISEASQLDTIFGSGNWECLPDYSFGAKVFYLNSELLVEYPFTTVDMYDGSKRGVGEVVPTGGEITAWFAGSIPGEQCR